MDGLRNGFSIGLDRGSVVGRRIFKNFKSAYENRESLSDAIESRLEKHKTVLLGPADEVLTELKQKIKNFFVFPMGAVPKPHDPSVMRPISDHTKTGSEQTNCAWHSEAQSRHLQRSALVSEEAPFHVRQRRGGRLLADPSRAVALVFLSVPLVPRPPLP